MRRYFVYIMTNHSRTLYTGVTSDLERRILEHKRKVRRGFTKKYQLAKLVWFEDFYGIDEALLAEKRIKGWLRAKKVALIEAANRLWLDLADRLTGGSAEWMTQGNPSKALRQTSG
jgi:putative endonuclease